MLKIIVEFLIALATGTIVLLTANDLINTEEYKLKIKDINILIVFAILIELNNYIFSGIEKPIVSYLIILLLIKVLFSETPTKIIIISLFIFILWSICDITFGIIAVSIFNFDLNDVLNNPTYEIMANTITISGIYMISNLKIIKNNLLKIIEIFNKEKSRLLFLIAIFISLGISVNMYKNMTRNSFDMNYVYNVIIAISFMFISLVIIKEKGKTEDLIKRYDILLEYMKSYEEQIEEERIKRHEDKNQLLVISGMVAKKNRKLQKHMKEIINVSNDEKCDWINELKYIPKGGLKGLVYYKIVEMKNNKVDVNINISKEIKKLELGSLRTKFYNEISKIIGVFLDNAKEAAIESERKTVNIEVYKKNNSLCFTISNTFYGNLQPQRFGNKGYSTKGRGRGYGLLLVKKIVETNNKIIHKKEVVNNLYIQHLIILIN